ncbi:hypothetical protein [Enterococcus sp. BWR-S5]|uniref:hypothetical protein n=1 Tax=Enterococcus sp. BWR-S5 TaxID=2787714 RepID=UPI001924D3A5|nr:hypothetical protein [Enterococcus sp. BWR-S5]MBL1226510.1 hypothetical protein [Enterococcus sp. BWR-S5]
MNGRGERYEYSFCKIKYVYQTNAIKKVKVYLSGGDKECAIERFFGWLLNVGHLSIDIAFDLKRNLGVL